MSKTYAIADLHGRLDVLEAALERIEASSSGGTVVFTGDYVDRGPDSKGVMDRLMAGPTKPGWKWICLKGNHEDMMAGAMRGVYQPGWWVGNGGGETLASFDGEVPVAYVDWAEKLPTSFCDGQRVFVHAGIDETIPFDEQTEQHLLWSRTGRNRDYTSDRGYVVHGHTVFVDGPVILAGRANLDTGACWTGRLIVAVFDDGVAGPPEKLMTVQCPTLEELEAA